MPTSKKPTAIVVGSGPSGVAAAAALLDARPDLHVRMLDAGTTLPEEKNAVLQALRSQEPEQWNPDALASIQGALPAKGSSLPAKLSFASDYPYAKAELERLGQDGTLCLQSHARGGLSTVWGASVLPFRKKDFESWPVPWDQWQAHYTAAQNFLGLGGVRDDLEEDFPFFSDPRQAPELGPQGKWILERARAAREPLRRAGFRFGQSRLAVRGGNDADRRCRYCGLCLTGCPYGSIWTATETLDQLRRSPRFSYEPGHIVRRLISHPERGVEIHGEGFSRPVSGRRVFLGAGPVSTAQIVLDSLPAETRELRLAFQPYFMLPLLSARSFPEIESSALHTLAQMFIEIESGEREFGWAHLQVYGYNSFISDRLARVLRWSGPLRGFLARKAAARLMFAQGYLHSDTTAGILVRYRPSKDSLPGRLSLHAPDLSDMRRKMKLLFSKLGGFSEELGIRPLSPAVQYGIPGEGNHIGGIFPMRREPGSLKTNALGELAELPNVHLIDSSSLTNLPPTTITLSVMANAHRIGTRVGRTLGDRS